MGTKGSVNGQASEIEKHTNAQSTPPTVRKAQTAAMARASLSDCSLSDGVVASWSMLSVGRRNLAARRRNDQQSHSE